MNKITLCGICGASTTNMSNHIVESVHIMALASSYNMLSECLKLVSSITGLHLTIEIPEMPESEKTLFLKAIEHLARLRKWMT